MSCPPPSTAFQAPAHERCVSPVWRARLSVALLVGGLHAVVLFAGLWATPAPRQANAEAAQLLMVSLVTTAPTPPLATPTAVVPPAPAPAAAPPASEPPPVSAENPRAAAELWPMAPAAAATEPARPVETTPPPMALTDTAPPAETTPERSGTASAASATYFSQLKGWLNRHKRYPAAAKKAKQQGVVTVNFTIDRRGELLASRIEKSSGHALLDDAALALLQRAAPMPRIPESMGLPTLTVSLPIDFSLITH